MRSVIVIYLFSLIMLIVETYINETSLLRIMLKVITSLIFFLVGLYWKKKRGRHTDMLLGIAFCMVGDVILAFDEVIKGNIIMLGLLSFLMAHLLFIISFSKIVKIKKWEFVFPVCAVCFVYSLSRFEWMQFGSILPWVVVYTFFVAWFATRGIETGRGLKYNSKAKRIIIGAILFCVSDLVLMFKLFYVGTFTAASLLNLSTYYIGVLLISISIRYELE